MRRLPEREKMSFEIVASIALFNFFVVCFGLIGYVWFWWYFYERMARADFETKKITHGEYNQCLMRGIRGIVLWGVAISALHAIYCFASINAQYRDSGKVAAVSVNDCQTTRSVCSQCGNSSSEKYER